MLFSFPWFRSACKASNGVTFYPYVLNFLLGIYLYPHANAQLYSCSWARAIRVKRNTFQQTKWEKRKRLVHVLLAYQNSSLQTN